jgi:toxin-antitoxin system PIN domain toxin
MICFDANLMVYAINTDSPFHQRAKAYVEGLALREDVAVSELVLVEFYTLLRNPVVLEHPLGPAAAVAVIQHYRRHPRWAVLGFDPDSAGWHEELWRAAAREGFARRRIYDARLALSLRRQGVTEFATCNVKDFEGFGLKRVWNPLEDESP